LDWAKSQILKPGNYCDTDPFSYLQWTIKADRPWANNPFSFNRQPDKSTSPPMDSLTYTYNILWRAAIWNGDV